MTDQASSVNDADIAIVGMAARLPGSSNVREFWSNLRAGVEGIRDLGDDELSAEGVPAEELAAPNYVRRAADLAEMECFDAEFFGFSPKEAAILDPQHRHFLECAWEALEDAGHPPEAFAGRIGVYAGSGMAAYFARNLLTNPELVRSVGLFLLRHTGNDKDFLTTRVSYLLDLKGPSVNLQTACSTSLVATHAACQSLLNGECDLALAGGVTIEIPHRRGYLFKRGEILSADGRCRSFDHRSQGTVFGSGVGVVVLRRLQDALEDRDHVYAVVKGSAINNDGSGKVGYLAPSVDGQAEAIAEAIAVAGVSADSIGYVECHGTGTQVGDPIEIAAMTQAFRQSTEATGFCGVGSVKSNIGHLDTAAGAASLIKAALALEHAEIPPTLGFEAPNPTIPFSESPFYVAHELRAWPRGAEPRRAGVNSLGVGGTNAHVVLEEAPAPPVATPSQRSVHLIALSGRNKAALDGNAQRLAQHLREEPDLELADVAYTLLAGRRAFDQRRVFACRDRAEAIELLESGEARRVFTHRAESAKASVVFLLPGGGAQNPTMVRQLFETEPVFREHVERGLAALDGRLDVDLRELLFAPEERHAEVAQILQRPSVQLPAIFLVEYALSQLWMSWGVRPAALLGHSMGENAAACVAGVFSFEDALGLVTLRGQLFERVPSGGMLSVSLPAEELRPLLGDRLDLASANSPGMSVASGSSEAIEELQRELEQRDVDAQRVAISIAAHSRLLEPILGDFRAYLRSIALSPPEIPVVSNYTGTWLTDEEATDPDYWVRHLRNTIRFAEGVATLLEDPDRIFLEVGPGKTLGSLARQHDALRGQPVFSSMPHQDEDVANDAYLWTAFGRLWACGLPVDASVTWQGEDRRRVSLPTYAFQHQPYWIAPGKALTAQEDEAAAPERIADPRDWTYQPVWEPRLLGSAQAQELGTCVIFLDEVGVGSRLAARLRARGHSVVTVREGDAYYRSSDTEYTLSPEHGRGGYDALVHDLVSGGHSPGRIIHLWALTGDAGVRPGSSPFHHNLERGFYSLFFLAQALGDESTAGDLHLTVVSDGMQRVDREPLPHPEKATLLGPVKVVPRELPHVTCTSVDVTLPAGRGFRGRRTRDAELDALAERLEAEVLSPAPGAELAYRNGQRLERVYQRMRGEGPEPALSGPVRENAVVLITGGLGGLGLVVAESLARSARARLVLLGRHPLPERNEWDAWLRRHGPSDATSQKIQRVRELESLGAEVLVRSADVTDVEAMRAVVAEARERFGSLHGVVHTAGIVDDDLIQLKTQADVEEVFAPKIHGTLVLDELLGDADLDFFVLFSSTSAITGPVGQVDYVAANAFLNAYAQSRAGAGGRTVAIDWGVWNEVGMAARAAAGASDADASSPAPLEPVSHPLFDHHTRDAQGRTVLLGRLAPEDHWVLDEHRTRSGQALLPGTAYIELARAALHEVGEFDAFEVRDLYFFRPLYVPDGESREIRVRLQPSEQGYVLEVQSRCDLDDGRPAWQTHAQAQLHLRAPELPAPVQLAEIEAACDLHRTRTDAAGLRTSQEDHLAFGPRWRVLHQASFAKDQAIARLALPEPFRSDLADYAAHPALLDIATGFAMTLIEGYEDSEALWVPIGYRRIRMHRPLPAVVRSWVRSHGTNRVDEGFAHFDVVVTDESGEVVLEADEFAMKRLEAREEFVATPSPAANELELDAQEEDADESQLSPAELAFRGHLRHGIRPAEGSEALQRILGGPAVPEIVVSSLDLDALKRQLAALATRAGDAGTKFARPELDSEYVEPKDEIERTLAGFWEELLGVDRVGTQDNFFDLGGHSLIAVRLFARIKKAFEVEYPISVLFEAPTIEGCSDLIRESIGERGQPQADGQAAEPRTRFTHLVPMHPGEGGPEPPFFLAAGMFGNILNLRHLAHLIGTDRPFYGLQARGLYGGHEPHETFEEMARDYLAEVRTVQPRGPYYLGGFSGGGLVALEMAQQLLAEGEEVAFLLMLDTPMPIVPTRLTARDKVVIHWQRLLRRGPAYLTEAIVNRVRWEWSRRVEGRQPEVPESSPAQFQSLEIEAAFRRALDRYEPQSYPGEITLIRPKLDRAHDLGGGRVVDRRRFFVFEDNGWGPWAQSVQVHEVPGDHDSMVLEPNVRVLASRLRTRLERVRQRAAIEAGAAKGTD